MSKQTVPPATLWLRAWLVAVLLLPAAALSAPGDTLYNESFPAATFPWASTVPSSTGTQTGAQTRNSPPRGAFTRHTAVTATSPSFNAAVPAAELQIWIRRGDDNLANSESTDAGENFVIEFRTSGGSWVELITYLGSGTNGQIYNETFMLPSSALHGTLAIRVRQTAGSGTGYDYWHFDDVIVTERAAPPAPAVGSCQDFENGLAPHWTISATSGFAGTSNATSSSPTKSMYLNGGAVTVQSSVVDTSDITFTDLTMWIRRGDDSFSEDTDPGEDMVVEYLNNSGSWIALETFLGSGTTGQTYLRSYNLPAAGRHAGFRLRFRQTSGSGSIYDFWHVDDVCFVQVFNPILLVSKISQTISDPINLATNPKAIPGAVVRYTVGVTNQGPGAVDTDSIIITDPLPPGTAMYVGTSAGNPVVFVNGAVPSGLNYTYATDVTYSNQVGGVAPYTYVPVPDAQGFDPAITGYRINPKGAMNAASSGSNPSFNIQFRIRIE